MDHMLGSQSAFISRKAFVKFWTENIRSKGNLRLGSWSSKPSCDFLGPEGKFQQQVYSARSNLSFSDAEQRGKFKEARTSVTCLRAFAARNVFL
jgi:hypothetical protein